MVTLTNGYIKTMSGEGITSRAVSNLNGIKKSLNKLPKKYKNSEAKTQALNDILEKIEEINSLIVYFQTLQ